MLLDIGFGLIAALFLGLVLDFQPSPLFIFGSVVFSLLPDIDIAFHYLRGWKLDKWTHRHRDLLHYPLIFLLVSFLVLWFFGRNWALLFLLNSFWHFVHDSVGIGWGVKWLYPFSRKNFKFFTSDGKSVGKNLVVAWNQKELDELVEKQGDDNWLKGYLQNLYRPLTFLKIFFFLLALILLWLIFY